ncbi:response regulator [Candidatus Wolfebacteria bacterium]|nr:response regulator [Candidatus Wolfebacteria bacterium]
MKKTPVHLIKTENKKVLVVEDDRGTLEAISFKLRQNNIPADQSPNGEDALEKIKKTKYDLVLLDLLLPKKSGFDFLRAVKSDPGGKKQKIIVFTNLSEEYDRTVKDMGASFYILKATTSINKLVEMIKNELGK